MDESPLLPQEPPPSRGRPREFDREEVLERAVQVFWEGGYQATPISELVDRLGIGRQSLYLAFGGKKQLFAEALERYGRMELEPMHEVLDGPGSPLENVEALLSYWQDRAISGEFRGCLANSTVAELGSKDADVAAGLEHSAKRLEDKLTTTLRAAVDRGELTTDQEPRELARLLMCAAQGMTLWATVRRSRPWVRSVVSAMRKILR